MTPSITGQQVFAIQKDANRGNPSNYVYRNNFINQDARTAVAKYIKRC